MNLRMRNLRKFFSGIPTKIAPQFRYYPTGVNTATAYQYYGTNSNVKVDSAIDGYSITELAPTACNGNTDIETVIIPSSVTRID